MLYRKNEDPDLTADLCFDSLCPSQQFSSHVKVETSTKQRIKYLDQGHNAVPVAWLELAIPPSRVKHSTTVVLI